MSLWRGPNYSSHVQSIVSLPNVWHDLKTLVTILDVFYLPKSCRFTELKTSVNYGI
jgi:hypothetical protein